MSKRFLGLRGTEAIARAVARQVDGIRAALPTELALDECAIVGTLEADAVQSQHTGRTERLERPLVVQVGRKRYECAGTVSSTERAAQFGRGTEADHYPLLDGAPVGCPETLRSRERELAAALDEQRWARQCARAEQGIAVTRNSLRNAKRAARRARATTHTEE